MVSGGGRAVGALVGLGLLGAGAAAVGGRGLVERLLRPVNRVSPRAAVRMGAVGFAFADGLRALGRRPDRTLRAAGLTVVMWGVGVLGLGANGHWRCWASRWPCCSDSSRRGAW